MILGIRKSYRVARDRKEYRIIVLEAKFKMDFGA
jgi:hypothetical protein